MPIIRWTRGAEGVNYHHKSANQTPDYKYITYTAKLFSWKIFFYLPKQTQEKEFWAQAKQPLQIILCV